jgi:hypothetical protein
LLKFIAYGQQYLDKRTDDGGMDRFLPAGKAP